MSEEEKLKFVTIELSKKQVLTDQGVIHSDKTNKDYVRCLIPDGGTFLYPTTSLKVKESDPNVVYFSRPAGTEMQLRYSHLKDGVDAKDPNIPNKEKYETRTETVTIEELSERIKSKGAFIGIDISKKLVTNFNSHDGREWSAVHVPVYEDGSKDANFYEIVVDRKRILDSEQENKVYLSLFVNRPDGTPYVHTANRDVLNTQTGDYDTVSLEMTSEEVIEHFKESARRYKENNQSKTLADEIGGPTR